MIEELFNDAALIGGCKWVDDVVHTGLGDDEGVTEALAFGAFGVWRKWILS